jgi:hypothetical protein
MIVLILAALHAVPVVGAAAYFKSRHAVVWATILMAMIGSSTGNPVYMLLDYIGIGIGWFIANSVLDVKRKEAKALEAVSEAARHPARAVKASSAHAAKTSTYLPGQAHGWRVEYYPTENFEPESVFISPEMNDDTVRDLVPAWVAGRINVTLEDLNQWHVMMSLRAKFKKPSPSLSRELDERIKVFVNSMGQVELVLISDEINIGDKREQSAAAYEFLFKSYEMHFGEKCEKITRYVAIFANRQEDETRY